MARGRLAGFFDWDMAGPVSPACDVAFAAFSRMPLHARHGVAREGFTDFEDRPRRLRLSWPSTAFPAESDVG